MKYPFPIQSLSSIQCLKLSTCISMILNCNCCGGSVGGMYSAMSLTMCCLSFLVSPSLQDVFLDFLAWLCSVVFEKSMSMWSAEVASTQIQVSNQVWQHWMPNSLLAHCSVDHLKQGSATFMGVRATKHFIIMTRHNGLQGRVPTSKHITIQSFCIRQWLFGLC